MTPISIENTIFAREQLTAAVFVLAVYLILPTMNFYWDGVLFALNIETAPHWPALLHANHLIYELPGSLLYHALGRSVRALYLLQTVNSACAAIAFYLLSGIVLRATRSVRAALLLAAFFAFSGTWWRFATDADAYIPSITLLIASAALLLCEKPRVVSAALLHVGAMLFHQLAIFFLPAALVVLWRRGRRVQAVLYAALSGLTTLSAYIAAFRLQSGAFSLSVFRNWITSHAEDVSFSFNLPKNLAISLRSWVQLFVAGRPSLVRYFDPLTIVLLVACVAALICLAIALYRRTRLRIAIHDRTLFLFAMAWIASYVLFLFFWLPNNTFYKLFALPAVILLIASCWTPGANPSIRGAALPFVALLALSNLTFAIVPYSKPTANEAVAFALGLKNHLASGTNVYFWSFNTDDWFARYFNPQTNWQQAGPAASIGDGWLETTAIDHFSQTDPGWLKERTQNSEWCELVNARHRIRFVRLQPGHH